MDILTDWVSDDEDMPSPNIPIRTYQKKSVYLSPAQIRQNKTSLKEDLKKDLANVSLNDEKNATNQSTKAEIDVEIKYRFFCKLCKFKTNFAPFMRAHFQKHKRKRKVICEKCFREFNKSIDLLKHIKKVHKKLEYKCKKSCNFRSSKTTTLRKHIAAVHETVKQKPAVHSKEIIPVNVNNPLTCKICEYTFVKEKLLKKHMKLHEGKTCFECPICQNRFQERCDLRRVTDTEGGLFQFQCKCKCIFTLVNPFKPKLVISETERPFQCNICTCKFRYPHVLQMHIKSHQERTAYKCMKCDNTYRLMAHLVSHMKAHNNVAT